MAGGAVTAPIDYFGTGKDGHADGFLSNFYEVSGLIFAGAAYPTVEHAYQAAKTLDLGVREEIRTASTPKRAKQLGRGTDLRPGWDRMKAEVMYVLLGRKFAGPYMARLLIATAPAELIEGNWWHDNYWGDCRCGKRHDCRAEGQNMLGELLMSVRDWLRREYSVDPLENLVVRER